MEDAKYPLQLPRIPRFTHSVSILLSPTQLMLGSSFNKIKALGEITQQPQGHHSFLRD